MYNEHTVAVVVPAYNEAGFVGDVIETLPPFVDRVYAIDDRSTDETWAEITAAAEAVNNAAATSETASRGETASTADATSTDGGTAFDRRVVPIRHETNRGVGGAIKTGYLRAREDGVDVTAVMGGDGQMDPDYLERIIRPITTGEAEYAKGNRLLNRADHTEMPRFRLVGNRILTLLTKIASGYWRIGDPQMGYTAISLKALRETDIENMYEFYGYCNDLLVRLNVAGHRVADVPSPLNYGDEHSDINYLTYIPRVSLMLLRTFLWRLWSGRRSARGMATLVLYVGGAAGTVGSLLAGLADDSDQSTASALGGIFVLLVAMVVDGLFNWPQNSRIDPEE